MRLAADLTLVGGRFLENRSVEVAEGRVTEIPSFPQLPPSEAGSPDLVRLSGKALLPGTVNTHCHTFPGMDADLVAIDLAHPSLHPPTKLLKNVVYAMSPQAVTDVWVRGRQVVRSQRLTMLDQDGLMERVRALTRDWSLA
jgi:cytosine/adenosine deaminase-related metal-dependent hydrolase